MYFCIVCGIQNKVWKNKTIISNNLANTWRLSKELQTKFNLRESQFCQKCGNSSRSRAFAQAIMYMYPFPDIKTFEEWTIQANKKGFTIAEINSCGKLHPYLRKINKLAYSEYPSSRFLTRLFQFIKKIPIQDITHLSYKNNSFDLVLHSEVLEHVADIEKAINECQRILKPKGKCLFTIPYIPKRKTIQCAKIDKFTGSIIYLKSPSYHGFDNRKDYLVWWEFGGDFINKYNVSVIYYDLKIMTYVFEIKNE